MEKDIFNLSADMINRLEQAAATVNKVDESITVADSCVCCGSGICCVGIADD